jgi:formamidopyrimidine-DNA glycosylase
VPEILEVEMYRRGAAATVGRTIEAVETPDDWFLKGIDARSLAEALVGAKVRSADRIGKLMMLDTSAGRLGLRFGMTGRLVIDGEPVIAALEYSSSRLDPAWVRFGLRFRGGGRDGAKSLDINDPRRLGGVEFDPDVGSLGPDAWAVDEAALVDLFGRYRVAVKALLLNQSRLAGLGNLLVDELLWRAGLVPSRSAAQVAPARVREVAALLPAMLDELLERGGSHRGDLFDERRPGGRCPRDHAALAHATIAGRSSWWCPQHQR